MIIHFEKKKNRVYTAYIKGWLVYGSRYILFRHTLQQLSIIMKELWPNSECILIPTKGDGVKCEVKLINVEDEAHFILLTSGGIEL